MKLLIVVLMMPILWTSCKKDQPVVDGDASMVIRPSIAGDDGTNGVTFDDFWLNITGPDGFKPVSRRLGNDRTLSNIPDGNYTVTLTSSQAYEMPAFDLPFYKGQLSKNVSSDAVSVFDVLCEQSNAGVKFEFDASVIKKYTMFGITLTDSEGASLSYSDAFGRTAWFDAPGTVTITLNNGGTVVPIESASSAQLELAPGELWKVTFKLASSNSAGVEMDVESESGGKPEPGGEQGNGQPDNPYSVAAAVKVMPTVNVWIEGYIVGSLGGGDTHATDNILIAASPDSGPESSIFVELPAHTVRDGLNLVDNPRNLGLRVALRGDMRRPDSSTGKALGKMSNTYNYSLNYFRDLNASVNYKFTDKVLRTSAPFPIGTAYTHHLQDPTYINIIRRDFNRITSEYNMKMGAIWKNGPENYDFSGADRVIAFAQKYGLDVHGHVLIWSQDTEIPEWLEEMVDLGLGRDEWIDLMNGYIRKVITHFKGKVTSWDVVNEACNWSDGTLRGSKPGDDHTFWYDRIGPEFISIAFHTARSVLDELGENHVKLFYNDYDFVRTDKRAGMLEMIRGLIEDGVPIDGVGMQLHQKVYVIKDDIRTAFAEVSALGLLIHASEIDILVNSPEYIASAQKGYGNGPLIRGDHITADELYFGMNGKNNYDLQYAQGKSFNTTVRAYLDIVPSAQQYGITMWGITDKTSYVGEIKNYMGYPDYAHSFGTFYNKKRAYDGILEGLNGIDWEAEDDIAWDWRWINGEFEPKAPWL